MAKKKKEVVKKEETKFKSQDLNLTVDGITRPAKGNESAVVWDICDELTKELGFPCPQIEALEEASKAGIDEIKANRQFKRWERFNRRK